MKFFFAALALAAAACGQSDANAEGQGGQPRVELASPSPQLTGRVVDNADLLDGVAERALTDRLEQLEAQTSDQVVVVTVPTLGGLTIEKYSFDLANRWGIGRADVNNGVLLVVAPNERKVRIEVGLGLEGLLTDEKATEIIQSILPAFRAGQMQQGVLDGEAAIEAVLKSNIRRPQPKLNEMKKPA